MDSGPLFCVVLPGCSQDVPWLLPDSKNKLQHGRVLSDVTSLHVYLWNVPVPEDRVAILGKSFPFFVFPKNYKDNLYAFPLNLYIGIHYCLAKVRKDRVVV